MRLALCIATLLVISPLAADEKKTAKAKTSGCAVGEGTPKFSVAPVTGRYAKRKSICYI